jgi:hypothetical protein
MLKSTIRMHKLAGFPVFIDALNNYLFDVLCFDPKSQFSKVSPIYFEYYFEDVFLTLLQRNLI